MLLRWSRLQREEELRLAAPSLLSPRPQLVIHWEHHFKQEHRRLGEQNWWSVGTVQSKLTLRGETLPQRKGSEAQAVLTTQTHLLLIQGQTGAPQSKHFSITSLALALGFRCLYSMMGLQERCIRNVCGLNSHRTGKRENQTLGRLLSSSFTISNFTISLKVFKGLGLGFIKK